MTIKLLVLALLLAMSWAVSTGQAQAADNPVVIIETSKGTIEVELYPDKAPITVKNFLGYVEDKFYDGLIFHRTMKKFMIQGGGFEPGMKQKKTKDPIKNEAANGLSNARGTIAMARTMIADSATSQFYINVVDNDGLDRKNAEDGVGYCVFGKVIKGLDVADAISNVEVHTVDRHGNVPKEDIVIKSIRVKK